MSANSSFEVGQLVADRFELRRVIGSGAEGVVYEAKHRFLRRQVALKTVVTSGSPALVEQRKRRLLREAYVLGGLRLPGVVAALDAGTTADGVPYLAMELLDGKTLEALIAARGKLGASESIAVALDLARTLAGAHARGVLHRDVKPANVLVVRQPGSPERTKLLDFGTSKVPAGSDANVTVEGAIIGTPAYMAPEQLAGGVIDERADVYSLGALLFECLTGEVVYPGNFASVVKAALSSDPVPALGMQGVTPRLEAIVARALAKEPDARFQSMEQLADALAALQPPGAPVSLLTPISVANQRRRHDRVPFLAPVSLREGEARVDGRCEDISESGMLVLARGACTEGRIYQVRFGAPVSGRIVTTNALARWVRVRQSGGWAIGFEFEDPPAELANDVRLFVRLMTQPAPIPEEELVEGCPTSLKPTLLGKPAVGQ